MTEPTAPPAGEWAASELIQREARDRPRLSSCTPRRRPLTQRAKALGRAVIDELLLRAMIAVRCGNSSRGLRHDPVNTLTDAHASRRPRDRCRWEQHSACTRPSDCHKELLQTSQYSTACPSWSYNDAAKSAVRTQGERSSPRHRLEPRMTQTSTHLPPSGRGWSRVRGS